MARAGLRGRAAGRWHRLLPAALLVVALALAGAAGAAERGAEASARATGVRVVVPGGEGAVAVAVEAPPPRSASSEGYEFGESVSTGAIEAGARAGARERATASSSVVVRDVSLFGGEIVVGEARLAAGARADSTGAGGSVSESAVEGVTVLGREVRARANARVELGDWGYVVFLEQAVVRVDERRLGYRGFVTGLHVHLTADHGGLPAGSEVMVGSAEAAASAPKAEAPSPAPEPPPPTTTEPPPPTTTDPPPPPRPAAPSRKPAPPPPAARPKPPPPAAPSREPAPQPPGARPAPPPIVRTPPPGIEPALTRRGYVFPVYGPASFSDDFGAARALTGWHHGNDIFASLGAPVLAVADGTLFLVGWNEIGGNRVWLRDSQGNEFYYAHLSAYSPLAFDGSKVRAGDVIGFVGDTGDAVGTPPHLHFEIHPRELLGLGYDGVVDPFAYLSAWRRLDDVSFDAAWTPAPGKAPPPAVVLLDAEDISSVTALDPTALKELLAVPPLFGEGKGPVGPRSEPPEVVGAPPGFGAT